MKETRAEVQAKLAERQARLREFETKGIDALSKYDVQIAFSGDAELALRTSTQLVKNHIAWWTRKLEEMPPEQGRLF